MSRSVIALLLESDGPGGAEFMLLHLAEGLRCAGYEVCPVLPANGCGWLAGQFRERGYQPEAFHLRRAVDWGCVRGLREVFARRRVTLAHSHEFTMAVYAGMAAWLQEVPHVITLHGSRRFAEQRRRRLALRWAVQRSRATAAVSEPLARFTEQALGLTAGRLAVVPNGIDFQAGDRGPLRAELGLAQDEPLILAVGSLYQVKGHIVLLRALARLASERPDLDWRCAIAGKGEEEPALRAFIRENQLEARVHLLGYRTDVPNLLAAADIWTMPSLSEGLPLALLEAMLAAKPIVASAVGGMPAVLEGGAGLLVPAGDDAAFAEALATLLADPVARERLAAEAYRRADLEYRLERMIAAYERLYAAPGR